MFMDGKNPYCQDISSSQLDLQIQCNCNQNPSKLLCAYGHTDSNIYTEAKGPEQATQYRRTKSED